MMVNMERRQKYLEDILKRQQRQISKISKELELHREFLNLQFESFLEFLMRNGGQMIKNGKNEGMFIPMKKERNGQEDNAGNDGDGEDNRQNGGDRGDRDHEGQNGEENETRTKLEEDNGEEGEDMMEPLPPPQAILGSPSGAECSDDNQESTSNVNYQKQNGSGHGNHGQDKANSSRRSSANVVSSSDAHNGDGDNEEYDEVDSSGEYENSNGLVDPANMLKYVQNFMFSHFLDGGNGEENGMDESYNDDENGGYEGEDDEMEYDTSNRSFQNNGGGGGDDGRRGQQSWANTSGSMRNAAAAANLQHLAAKQVSASNHNLPIPSSNMPHNERTCRYCGKTFHWKQSWVIHERTHTGEKPYLCKCGKAFSQKSNMNTHAKSCAQAMTTQKGKTTVFQMKCSHCQKMFTHKKNLDLHMEKFHPEVLNLSVKPSTSSSSSPSSSMHHYQNGLDAEAAAARAAENAAILNILKTVSSQVAAGNGNSSSGGKNLGHGHGQVVTMSSQDSNEDSMSGGEDKNGRYPCPYCPKRFPVKGTLERHLRVHTGEKPFLCGICGKAFTQKGSVKLHLERVHRQTMAN